MADKEFDVIIDRRRNPVLVTAITRLRRSAPLRSASLAMTVVFVSNYSNT